MTPEKRKQVEIALDKLKHCIERAEAALAAIEVAESDQTEVQIDAAKMRIEDLVFRRGPARGYVECLQGFAVDLDDEISERFYG